LTNNEEQEKELKGKDNSLMCPVNKQKSMKRYEVSNRERKLEKSTLYLNCF